MKDSLCGKKKCPGICIRVCHCQAGLARSKELLGMLRNRREMPGVETSLYSLFPPERWHEVEFQYEARHQSGVFNQPEHKKPPRFYHTHFEPKKVVPYTRALKPLLSWAFVTGLFVFIGIVILLGLAINGGDFAPGYEPPQIYTWDSR